MTSLASLTPDRERVATGEWITVGIAPNTFRLRVRGVDTAFRDMLHTLRRDAAAEANRRAQAGARAYQLDSLPPSYEERCQARAIVNHVLEVADLETADGTPVSVEAYREMLLSGDHPLLLQYTMIATARVGEQRAELQSSAEGN